MISELRPQGADARGTLSLNYYDANKTGALVSRIMSDVEGIRNLIGTGLVEFCGGVLTAVLRWWFLLKYQRADDRDRHWISGGARWWRSAGRLKRSVRFSASGQDQCRGYGRLTESLGGVRVVKGYHAEERESNVFSRGVQRLLDNVLKSLTATSLMGLTSTVVLGVVSAIIMFMGARQILAGHMTTGPAFQLHHVYGLFDCSGGADGQHRHADH